MSKLRPKSQVHSGDRYPTEFERIAESLDLAELHRQAESFGLWRLPEKQYATWATLATLITIKLEGVRRPPPLCATAPSHLPW
jgi:hypothetical protein